MSISFLLDEKPTVVPVGSAGEQSGGAQEVPYGAVRSNSERAAPSACVGKNLPVCQAWHRVRNEHLQTSKSKDPEVCAQGGSIGWRAASLFLEAAFSP